MTMRRSKTWRSILSVVALGAPGSLGELWAVIHPDNFRRGHPECISLRVAACHLEESPDISKVSIAAKVIEVFRTTTDLKPGDLILITYQQDHKKAKKDRAEIDKLAAKGVIGGQVFSFPPTLKSGDVRVAHLAKAKSQNTSGSVYTPQAHQHSFEPESAKSKYRK